MQLSHSKNHRAEDRLFLDCGMVPAPPRFRVDVLQDESGGLGAQSKPWYGIGA